jgi:hypothetical protein
MRRGLEGVVAAGVAAGVVAGVVVAKGVAGKAVAKGVVGVAGVVVVPLPFPLLLPTPGRSSP